VPPINGNPMKKGTMTGEIMIDSIDDRLHHLIDKAVEILRTFGATEIYLFGSARNGEFDPGDVLQRYNISYTCQRHEFC
jgi:hypothetical protein